MTIGPYLAKLGGHFWTLYQYAEIDHVSTRTALFDTVPVTPAIKASDHFILVLQHIRDTSLP